MSGSARTAERNFANRTLYHGDNLDFLRGMNSGTVNLIATDPPFNKSRDFHATPDSLAVGASFQDRWSWQDDIHDDWLIAIQRDEPEVWAVITTAKKVYGDDMAAFLCWMAVRLLEMHRLLADDGSIYLHIDHTAHAWVKCLMDAVFGKHNFRNEIVWCYSTSGRAKRFFAPKHDSILLYTKSADGYWGDYRIPVSEKYLKSHYRQRDEAGKRVRIRVDAGKERVYYPEEGMTCNDWWEIPYVNSMAKERTGYPTQKPLALYERMVEASSRVGDVVLDPFCGCATTPVAAERLGRQWVGMDIWDGAHQIVLDRLEKEQLAVKGRRRRGGQQALTFGDITYSTIPPKRTDDGEPATLVLRTPTGKAQRFPPPRTQHGKLLADMGAFCQGCGADYQFDTRVLEVDHVNPRSQGGTDAYENLTLLCPPCNKEKRDRYTLIGLQQFNRQQGFMRDETRIWTRRTAGRKRRR